MRILDKEGLRLGLPELGFFTDDQQTFERMIQLSDGILLVTGPTGSGKTTTLYACLNVINRPDKKIITVEDPVEYELEGINQVPVNASIGMTFPAALRSMLRQAPNIIMIGEIGGSMEAEAAEWIRDHGTKPVVGFIAGQTAPKGRRMGHAGAIVGGKDDTAQAKMEILAANGIHVVDSPAEIGQKVLDVLS